MTMWKLTTITCCTAERWDRLLREAGTSGILSNNHVLARDDFCEEQ